MPILENSQIKHCPCSKYVAIIFYFFLSFIKTNFGHGQCFIWEFLVLPFIETARLNSKMTQFWSVNYIYQVCKLKILFRTCLKFWIIFTYIDRFELLLNIFYRRSVAIVIETMPFDTFWRSRKLLFLKKILSNSSYNYLFI